MRRLHSKRIQRVVITGAIAALFLLTLTTIWALHRPPAAYVPGDKVEGLTETLAKAIPPDYPNVTFADVTEKAGIRFRHFSGARTSQIPEDMGSGAAWGDYDGDGYPDLFLPNQAGPLTMSAEDVKRSQARCALYHNNRDGTFTEVTDAAGLGDLRGQFMGAAWGDYDNDGRPDLFVTAYGENRLFHNEGGGRFRDVTAKAHIGGLKGFWTGCSWADYDRDGHLDLYVCGYVRYRSPRQEETASTTKQFESDVPFTLNPSSYVPERNLLYHNRGDGTFEEVAKQAGVDDPTGRSLSAAWCDFDHDGWPDLYVNNDVSMHAFYRNLGNGKFQDVSTASWACDYRGGMGIAIGDWDNNGDVDMFLTHWIAQESALYENIFSSERKRKPKTKVAHFIDISDEVGLGQSSLDYIKWGCSFVDFDNDGRLDLVVANGSTFEEPANRHNLIKMRNQLYWNGCRSDDFYAQKDRDRGFFEVEDAAGSALIQPNVGRGLAVADYDRDGAPDVLITRNGDRPLLLHNDGGNRRSWLEVKLIGKKQKDAVGARITIRAGGKTQTRLVGAESSYLSQDDLVQCVGLGDAQKADWLDVEWPDGARQRFQNLPARRFLSITEGAQPRDLTVGKARGK